MSSLAQDFRYGARILVKRRGLTALARRDELYREPADARDRRAHGAGAAVALVACLVPARRATRVDPTVALRYE